jgi:ElaB/YqjD/DUF883 family membrane-anchored ribosome-binding protein
MTTAYEINRDQLVIDLKRVVRDSEELLKASAGTMGEKATALRERLSETLESAKDTYRQIEDKAMDRVKSTDKLIRDRPYESIAVAFGVGMLAGVLLTRK